MSKTRNDFDRATETLEQRTSRLKAQAKQLDDALRKPPKAQRHYTPKGMMRVRGDNHARQVIQNKRINVQRDLDKAKTQIKAKEQRMQKTQAKTMKGREL